jgi:hypothetical protein
LLHLLVSSISPHFMPVFHYILCQYFPIFYASIFPHFMPVFPLILCQYFPTFYASISPYFIPVFPLILCQYFPTFYAMDNAASYQATGPTPTPASPINQSTHNFQPSNSYKCTQLTPKTVSVVPPEDGRLTPETCRGLRHSKVMVKVKVY